MTAMPPKARLQQMILVTIPTLDTNVARDSSKHFASKVERHFQHVGKREQTGKGV